MRLSTVSSGFHDPPLFEYDTSRPLSEMMQSKCVRFLPDVQRYLQTPVRVSERLEMNAPPTD